MKKRARGARRRNDSRRAAPLRARDAILQAAEEEFAAAGYGGARADRLAARAKVNKALPFYYFGSKAELYAEVLRLAMQRVANIPSIAEKRETALPSQGCLVCFARNMFELMARDRNLTRLIVRELIEDGDRSREFVRQYLKPLIEISVLKLSHEMEAGLVVRTDPLQILMSVFAEVFFYFVLAPVLEGMGLEDPLAPGPLAARQQTVLELVRRGFCVDEPPGDSRGPS